MPVECPYCGERKSESGLRGHIMLQDDDSHGPLGHLPDDFEPPHDRDEWETLRNITTGEGEDEEVPEQGLLKRLLG